MAIFNSAAYAIVLFTFTLLELLKDSLSEAIKYNIVGHLIILFLTITVVTNLMVGFVSSILAFRDLGRQYIWGKGEKASKGKKVENTLDLDDSSIKSLNQVKPTTDNKFKKKPRTRKVKKGRLSNQLRRQSEEESSKGKSLRKESPKKASRPKPPLEKAEEPKPKTKTKKRLSHAQRIK